MSLIALLLVALLGTSQDQAPSVSLSDVDSVSALYASAAYEEVLQRVAAVPAVRLTARVEQYRALSLMALGRAPEAEQAFERMVRSDPTYLMAEGDVSPRVFGVFRTVRQRVLPAVVRELYARGKSLYDQKQFDTAATQFTAMLSLLGDAALAQPIGAFDDLKQLAQGFLRLAELETQLAARTAAAAAPVASAPAAPPANPDAIAVTRIVIYSADDAAVTPPVEVDRRMPPWTPPTVMARNASYAGTLEVVVNEVGAVESAQMIRPMVPAYDLVLLDAARRWRYTPARFNNQTVKYRLTYNVALTPRR